MQIEIEVEQQDGTKVGAGPITTATAWKQVRRLSRAGEFSFAMPATDPRGAYVVDHPGRVVRAYGQLAPGGARLALGAGVVQAWETRPAQQGGELAVSGGDLLRMLTWPSVGFLTLADSAGNPVNDALARIMALAPGWALDPAGYPSTGALDYGAFAGETVLAALVKLAEHDGQQFRLGAGQTVRWLRGAAPGEDGVLFAPFRAVQGGDPVALESNTNVCLIQSLEVVADAWELVTAIHPYGAGNAGNRLTLAKTSRTAPTGFTLDAVNNLLVNTAAESALDGVRIERHMSWKEIGPISNSDTDLRSAANVLFDACLRELELRGQAQKTFRLSVTKTAQLLYPGAWIRVVYHGWAPVVDGFGTTTGRYHWIDVDRALVILEVSEEYGGRGLHSVGLTVSTAAVWPMSDAELQAQELESGRLYEAHPQLTLAYSPIGPYMRRLDSTHPANFVARIGKEVTSLNYAILRFKSEPLKSSIKQIAGASTTTSSGGGGTQTSSSGGGGTQTSGASSQATTQATDPGHFHTIIVSNSTEQHRLGLGSSVNPSGLVSDVTSYITTQYQAGSAQHDHGMDHSHDVGLPDHSHNVSVPAHTHSVTPNLTANYGIYQDSQYPTGLRVLIDGVDRTAALGGPWAPSGGAAAAEVNITTYLANASGGLRQNHTIQFTCAGGQGELEVEIDMLLSVQAIAMV